MTNQWRDPNDITDDLASGEAERIRVGLAGLREFTKDGDEFELPVIDASLLMPFGASPPEDIVIDLARLMARYRSFVPQPSRGDVIRQVHERCLVSDRAEGRPSLAVGTTPAGWRLSARST